jgi:hypothetical protein
VLLLEHAPKQDSRYVQGSAPKPVKRKLVGLLQGSFLKLAKLGAASRLLESLFVWCDTSDKQLIAQELADHLTELKVCCALSICLCLTAHASLACASMHMHHLQCLTVTCTICMITVETV